MEHERAIRLSKPQPAWLLAVRRRRGTMGPVALPEATSPGKVAAMSQPPQEGVERLKRSRRFWKRLAVASTSVLAAVLLAISSLFVYALWSIQVEHARVMTEFQRAVEETRKADEEYEQTKRRFEAAMKERKAIQDDARRLPDK